ncbi:MAG: oligosaccharide repeat unit polymerase [Olsenella sp.]|nr:oligosaccharide repeat unit polymerase [Olsenella sp.]
MVIYWLIFALVVVFIINYFATDGDFWAPQNIFTLGFLVATVFCTYLIDYFGVNLTWTTFIVIVLGVSAFSLGSGLALFVNRKDNNVADYRLSCKEYWPNGLITIFCIIFSAVTALLFIRNVIAVSGSFSTLANVTNAYRTKGYDGTQLQPYYVNQMVKVFKAIAYVYLFFFINNVVYTKKFRKNVLFLVPAALLIVMSIFGASRTELITLLVVTFTLLFLTYGRIHGFQGGASRKLIKWLIASVAAFLLVFSGMRFAVGRLNDTDPMTYISTYTGGSIELLDLYVRDEGIDSVANSFGEESFYALENDLGIAEGSVHEEFRFSATGILVGNVYTCFKKYLHDFGLPGMLIIEYILGLVFSWWYLATKRRLGEHPSDVRLLYFAYFYVPVVKSFVQEETLSMYFCLNSLIMALLFYLVYWLTTKAIESEFPRALV